MRQRVQAEIPVANKLLRAINRSRIHKLSLLSLEVRDVTTDTSSNELHTAEHVVGTWPSMIRSRCDCCTIHTENYRSQAHLTSTLPLSRDASLSKAE
jgi:hypothetical protein